MTNDDISCFLYFSVIPSKKSRCFWLSNSGGLMVDDPPKIAGRYTEKRRKLAARKKALYAEYRAAQQEMREAVAVKANIDHLLGLSDERKNKEQER